MAEIIRMPRMSDTMTEGVIVAWHKKVGDNIKSGDLLAEVETDKATMELESYQNGTLLYIGVDKGSTVPVDGVLAVIGKVGEEYASLLTSAPTATAAVTTTTATSSPAAAALETPASTAPAATATIDITKMEEVILMPRMSDTMTEGVIAGWNKKVGDKVKSGDLLAEVETDKATMELESYTTGTLLYIGVEKGGKVPVNGLLAIIGEEGKTDINAILSAAAAAPATPAAGEEQTATAQPAVTTTEANASTEHHTENGRVKASPLAKKLASEKGIDLSAVQGSGDGGRIIKKDIDSYTPTAAPVAEVAGKSSAPSVPTFVAGAGEGYTDTVNSQMRKTIARRLGESKFSAPHFYLKMEVQMDNAIAARKAMNEISPVKISFQDMMIKACAMALRLHPAVNSSWMGDFIRNYHHIHVGSAVAVEEGLIVPVFRFADQKSLSQIATEANDLYTKAKTRKLQPNEFTGNTFTISNLGMMDIDEFTAIINPPDSCILAVGKIKEVVVKTAEGFGVANMMTLTLSCDHRIVDGAVGARFLQTVKSFLENPVNMLV
jgi:pyruvate dehydrogenase E2 component (dihydrolipoamide acetyltransferase)